jgi:hypothetical protein
MTSDISSLGLREVEARPVELEPSVPIQALAGQRPSCPCCDLRSLRLLVSQHIHSHGTGPLLYFRVTCSYSLSNPALLCVVKVNLESFPAETSTHFRLLPRSLPRWSSSSCFVTAAVFLVSMREC